MTLKLRKGFRSIVVGKTRYQYCVSFPAGRPGLLIVYDGASKLELPLDAYPVPPRPDLKPTWRGKHGDKWVGKYEVAHLIQCHLQAQA